MIKPLHFHNQGELPEECFKLMGVSVKAEGSFGMFGTGLKYSIACILRWGGKIRIKTPTDTYVFSAVDTEVKGQPFQVVCCDGEPLGYTTDYGKNWEPWMVYRELYCNAKDEKGGLSKHLPDADIVISVWCEELNKAHEVVSKFILDTENRELVHSTPEVDVYKGKSKSVFYQGIKVAGTAESLYTYNIKRQVDLTEDRTAKSVYSVRRFLGKAMMVCADPKMLSRAVGCDAEYFESDFIYSADYAISPAMVQMVRKKHLSGNTRIDPSLLAAAGGCEPKTLSFTRPEQNMLDKAVKFLNQAGYQFSYPIKKRESEGVDIFGEAKDDTIFLTANAFNKGVFDLAATVLEEYARLHTGYGDYSRSLQTWLFEQVIKQASAATGNTL